MLINIPTPSLPAGGWKTYALAAATVVYAATGYYLGFLTQDQAISTVIGGTGLATLRSAINTATAILKDHISATASQTQVVAAVAAQTQPPVIVSPPAAPVSPPAPLAAPIPSPSVGASLGGN
ncbi:MAG TPA: hypothetical protein VGV37_06455 [Aliidongia sp.]|uniref:hypothetical protein n=1 Tax=Aliidongia sp. TaxID=1914230 RepID=UPI002DDD2700|nr:hypothetical protein [Aliidongia sp.]HEV2674167.1 hypothetical protein [Aliidongia sp.]